MSPRLTLLLSSWSLPASHSLADAARSAGWNVSVFEENPKAAIREDIVFYGGTDLALAAAWQHGLCLLETPFDLLARLPRSLLHRTVEYGTFGELQRLKAPTFIKPADPFRKAFDPGVYSSSHDIRAARPIPSDTPVLLAEPVEWLIEYRCFVLEGKLAAWSPYVNFGRPIWRPFDELREKLERPATLVALCDRVVQEAGALPPTFVVDVGMIEDRGWAVVEFNPAWCAGVLGADPHRVLEVLKRGTVGSSRLSNADRRWVIPRS